MKQQSYLTIREDETQDQSLSIFQNNYYRVKKITKILHLKTFCMLILFFVVLLMLGLQLISQPQVVNILQSGQLSQKLLRKIQKPEKTVDHLENFFEKSQQNSTKKQEKKQQQKQLKYFQQILEIKQFKEIKKQKQIKIKIKNQSEYLNLTITNINEIYSFTELGTIIQAKTQLKNDKKQTIFSDLNNQPSTQEVTAIFTTSGRATHLKKSLISFFTMNTYPIKKIIAVHDGVPYAQLNKLIESYQNITWVITNQIIGQLAAIDQAYKLIKTQYYFHTEDDWIYLLPGFIEYSLFILKAEPKASGVWLQLPGINPPPGKKWRVISHKDFTHQRFYPGFTLTPTLHRLKDYLQWPGGYSNLTNFASLGMGAGSAEMVISMNYIMKGYYHIKLSKTFVQHIGGDAMLKKYWKDRYVGTNGFKKLTDQMIAFEKWLREEDNREKQRFKIEDEKKFLKAKNNLITNLNQLYNFAEEGKAFLPQQSLRTNKNQTLFQTFGNLQAVGDVSVTVTSSGRADFLQKIIISFFKYNTYPIKKFIVINDGPLYPELKQLIKTFKNITWLITNNKIGQIAAIDVAYSYVQTEFYFHTQDDWQFIQPGFIEYGLHANAEIQNISQVIMFQPWSKINFIQGDKFQYITFAQSQYVGYGVGIHRMSEYKKFPGGFSNLTYFSSYGKGAGIAELIISMQYIMAGKYVNIRAENDFIRHIGSRNGGEKYNKDLNPQTLSSKKLNQAWARYNKWADLNREKLTKQVKLKTTKNK